MFYFHIHSHCTHLFGRQWSRYYGMFAKMPRFLMRCQHQFMRFSACWSWRTMTASTGICVQSQIPCSWNTGWHWQPSLLHCITSCQQLPQVEAVQHCKTLHSAWLLLWRCHMTSGRLTAWMFNEVIQGLIPPPWLLLLLMIATESLAAVFFLFFFRIQNLILRLKNFVGKIQI